MIKQIKEGEAEKNTSRREGHEADLEHARQILCPDEIRVTPGLPKDP